MSKYIIFKNDKERVCDNAACETLIKKGELAVKKTYSLKDPEYFHERCFKRRK